MIGMTHIVKETIHHNSKRIWGTFYLSDKSKTQFSMRKDESWFQWGNSTDNLCVTVDRVEQLCNRWLQELN